MYPCVIYEAFVSALKWQIETPVVGGAGVGGSNTLYGQQNQYSTLILGEVRTSRQEIQKTWEVAYNKGVGLSWGI